MSWGRVFKGIHQYNTCIGGASGLAIYGLAGQRGQAQRKNRWYLSRAAGNQAPIRASRLELIRKGRGGVVYGSGGLVAL